MPAWESARAWHSPDLRKPNGNVDRSLSSNEYRFKANTRVARGAGGE